MRLLAYYHPTQDPYALRAALRAAGWQQVAMRDGSLWRDANRPEHGWTAVHAPLFPGIARAYADSGVEVVDAVPGVEVKLPHPPVQVDLPTATTWAVVNPGRNLLTQVAAFPIPADAVSIGVNEATRRVVCSWQLCNDGFTDPKFQGSMGNPGRITRARFATTIPSGQWFDLGSIGIQDGTFSTTCALRCAATHGARVVRLYGHDLIPGNGLDNMTGHWDGSQLANVAAEVAAEIERMRLAGIRVVHVRTVDGQVIEDDGTAPAAPPASTAKRKRGRA